MLWKLSFCRFARLTCLDATNSTARESQWSTGCCRTCRPAGARFILVVEKDAVFQRLVEDRLFDDLPCIIITGECSASHLQQTSAVCQHEGMGPMPIRGSAVAPGSLSEGSVCQQQPVHLTCCRSSGVFSLRTAHQHEAKMWSERGHTTELNSLCCQTWHL